jgi:transposase-like protein
MKPSPKQSQNGRPRKWTATEKLRVVIESAALSEQELGEFLRREGLHGADLKRWREAAVAALGGSSQERSERAAGARRMKALERELVRKEKALAEAAALLVLKKKVQAIWGDEDDSTPGKSER